MPATSKTPAAGCGVRSRKRGSIEGGLPEPPGEFHSGLQLVLQEQKDSGCGPSPGVRDRSRESRPGWPSKRGDPEAGAGFATGPASVRKWRGIRHTGIPGWGDRRNSINGWLRNLHPFELENLIVAARITFASHVCPKKPPEVVSKTLTCPAFNIRLIIAFRLHR